MTTHIIAFSTKESMREQIEQIKLEDQYRVTLINSSPIPEEKLEPDSEKFSYVYGNVVEVHRMESGEIAVGIYNMQHKITFITADCVIFDSGLLGVNEKLVSQYEVLWAAGVDIDEMDLQPRVDNHYETTVEGIYYFK